MVDDRRAAIEIQMSDPLPLQGQLLALIAPNQIFDDTQVHDLLMQWNVEPVGYGIAKVFDPRETHGLLMNEVFRYSRDQKWI